jgi:hypothetical protein
LEKRFISILVSTDGEDHKAHSLHGLPSAVFRLTGAATGDGLLAMLAHCPRQRCSDIAYMRGERFAQGERPERIRHQHNRAEDTTATLGTSTLIVLP